jgi:hypothetical protein
VSDCPPCYDPDDPTAVECYRGAIRALRRAGVEFLVGGAYAFARYTEIARHTKDLDVFVRPADRDPALAALEAAGYRTEVTYTHWLAKAFKADHFIDLIYNSGNGTAPVDDGWFAHAVPGEVFGEPVRLCPAEESVWSKAFIMERHRYDGADIAHIIRARGNSLDWRRLLDRFGPNWRVLYSHLILFGFVYPAERDRVPGWVLRELNARLRAELEAGPAAGRVCRGTLLAATQYIPDVERWGYADARLAPHGAMTPQQVAAWTEGVRTGR